MSAKVTMTAKAWRNRWSEMADICTVMADRGDELIRLASMSAAADGFGAGGSGPSRSSEVPDSVADSTAKRLGDYDADKRAWAEPEVDDIVAGWIHELFGQVTHAAARLRRVQDLNGLIARRADQRVGRQPTGGECLRCARYVSGSSSDRLRAGLCDRCRKAFERWRTGRDDASVGTFCRLTWPEEGAA